MLDLTKLLVIPSIFLLVQHGVHTGWPCAEEPVQIKVLVAGPHEVQSAVHLFPFEPKVVEALHEARPKTFGHFGGVVEQLGVLKDYLLAATIGREALYLLTSRKSSTRTSTVCPATVTASTYRSADVTYPIGRYGGRDTLP